MRLSKTDVKLDTLWIWIWSDQSMPSTVSNLFPRRTWHALSGLTPKSVVSSDADHFQIRRRFRACFSLDLVRRARVSLTVRDGECEVPRYLAMVN